MTVAASPRAGRAWGWPGAVVLGALVAGSEIGSRTRGLAHSHLLPWILGRGLGAAGYLTLTALVCSGLWLHHPWRRDSRWVNPASQLRVHASLAAATAVLVAGHVVALALDRYAHVGWSGALVPGRSGYRPLGVAMGTAALYVGLLVGATAALAGRLGVGRHWLAVHRIAAVTFVMVWVHGVTAGSDSAFLRPVYVGTGVLVAALLSTRWYARHSEPGLRSRA